MPRTVHLRSLLGCVTGVLLCGAAPEAWAGNKFLDALQKMNEQVVAKTSAAGGAAPQFCISNVCIGDALAKYDARIDSAANNPLPSDAELYKQKYDSCTKERVKYNSQLDVANSLAKTPEQKAKLNMFSGQKRDDSYCVNSSKAEVTKTRKAIETTYSNIGYLLTSSSPQGTSDDLVKKVRNNRGLSYVAYDKTSYGRTLGAISVQAKNNAGTYADFQKRKICTPILAMGSMDKGDVVFSALLDPTTDQFIIVYVVSYVPVSVQEQLTEATNQYKKKFGKYATESGDTVYDGSNIPLSNPTDYTLVRFDPTSIEGKFYLGVSVTHPSLAKNRPLTEALLSSGSALVKQLTMIRPAVGGSFDNESQVLPERLAQWSSDYAESDQCAYLRQGLQKLELK